MIPAAFEYVVAQNVGHAAALLSTRDGAKILAGGHSLIPLMKLRLVRPELIVDIGRLAELRHIRVDGSGLSIGPLATHTQVALSPLVRGACAVLASTASVIGDQQVRNRGTIGGSLAHADPAADYPATLLALDAEITVESPRGRRSIPITQFFLSLLTSTIDRDELIVEVRVPRSEGQVGGAYLKMANKASHYAIVGVAALARLSPNRDLIREVTVGITGAGACPVRAGEVERRLRGKRPDAATILDASEHAAEGIELLDDIHATSRYRSEMVKVMTRRAIERAVATAGS